MLVTHVGDSSKLILDPDLDSYYLMDNTINKLPILAEAIGRTADLQAVLRYERHPAVTEPTIQILRHNCGRYRVLNPVREEY